MQKSLDVILSKNLSTYLWYAVKACILQTNNETESWFNNRFINVVSYNIPNAPWRTMHSWLKLDYMEHNEPERTFGDLMKFYSYNSNSIQNADVAVFVKKCINKYNYVQLELDEYFISSKDNYYKKHFYHPVLIYGYDEGIDRFQCIGFGKNNVFMKLQLSSLELYEGAYSAAGMIADVARWNPGYDVAATTIIRKDSAVPEFNREKFHNQLNQFLYSIPDPKYYGMMSQVHDVHLYGYGIDALKFVPMCIRQDGFEGFNIAYLDLIFIQERCVGLYQRMQWYLNTFGIWNAEANDRMNEYKALTKDYRKFHFFGLREFIKTRDIFVASSEKRFEIADQLDVLIEREQKILNGLVDYLLT